MTKWDIRFLELAKMVSTWSKDPSTKTGAVIVASDKRVVSLGFNGFARGIADDERLDVREEKYKYIIHCERNALLFAREPLWGHTLYTYPFLSCSECAAMVVQAGIVKHVAPMSDHPRFGEAAQAASLKMMVEAQMEVVLVPFK